MTAGGLNLERPSIGGTIEVDGRNELSPDERIARMTNELGELSVRLRTEEITPEYHHARAAELGAQITAILERLNR